MNFKTISILSLALGAALTSQAGTHVGISLRIGIPPPIIVRQAPPRPIVERVVVTPGPSYVWVAGHYSWDNNQWVWVPGAWITPPQSGARWVEGRWDATSQNWTEGHWEVVQVTSPAPPVMVVPPAPAVVEIQVAPPPPRREHPGHRPGRGYVWINGFWMYRDGHHVWVAGRWDLPPRRQAVWVEPRWEHRGHGYVFIEGHWR